jgi:hypothetical protein
MMFNAAQKIQQDFDDKTAQLLRINPKVNPRRFDKLNRERSEIIKRARRCNVNLRYV